MTMTMALIYITEPCMFCGERSRLDLDPLRYALWESGMAVQDVWPEMSPAERGLLTVGTHPACIDLGDEPDYRLADDPVLDSPSIEYPHGEGPYTFDSIDIYGNDPYEMEG